MKASLLFSCLFLYIFCLLLFCSCDKSENPEPNPPTDYSITEHWLSIPADNTKDIDIFYVYPTAWYKQDTSESNFCAIDNSIMLEISQRAFSRQATALETVGNIYAPYYRQADANYTLSLPEDQRWNVICSIPAKDITAAFDYYIKHYNQGKAFILLGHSQGANVLLVLLENYMLKNPHVYKQMICSYLIGCPVTTEFMKSNKHLKFAKNADDIGVIVSFNTQSPSVAPGENIVMGNAIGLVINPINWKRDETPASVEESLGSFMPVDSLGNFGMVSHFADACINLEKGVLECSSLNDSAMFNLSPSMGFGVYHVFDIPLYYYNLRENAEKRRKSFFNTMLF